MQTRTKEDYERALSQDLRDCLSLFNKKIVTISGMPTPAGARGLLHVKVNAPGYILNPNGGAPIRITDPEFFLLIYQNYLDNGVRVYFPDKKKNASMNAFQSGGQCIDEWDPEKCSICSTIEKVVLDIIHDKSVSRPESPANSSLIMWQEEMTKKGVFPTINPALIYAK